MALGDHNCVRHPRHKERECPHHNGKPQQEEVCSCPQDGRRTQLESMITLDGIEFFMTYEGTEAFRAQAAAARLRHATEAIGAKWS